MFEFHAVLMYCNSEPVSFTGVQDSRKYTLLTTEVIQDLIVFITI